MGELIYFGFVWIALEGSKFDTCAAVATFVHRAHGIYFAGLVDQVDSRAVEVQAQEQRTRGIRPHLAIVRCASTVRATDRNVNDLTGIMRISV